MLHQETVIAINGSEASITYLPGGAQWTNAWTGEKLDGGQTIMVATPLDIIPLFLRNGAKLPIRDLSD